MADTLPQFGITPASGEDIAMTSSEKFVRPNLRMEAGRMGAKGSRPTT